MDSKPTRPLVIGLALLQSMRPRQWSKNLFLFIALVFTDRWEKFPTVLGAFALFCCVSGAVYLLNDLVDRERDAIHPEKRNRPIASGRLPSRVAGTAALFLAAGGSVLGFAFGVRFGVVVLLYIGLQLAYTFSLKYIVLVDVFAIAAGFVLRAMAGAYAIGVPNSLWLLVCTLQLALFLGFGKRRNELIVLEENAGSHRKALEGYRMGLLDQLISIVLAGLVVSYAVYTIMSPTAVKHPMLVMTLPNVMYGIFRYLYLIQVENKGGSPETILLEDRPMQVNLVLWLVEVVLAFKLLGNVQL